jgi:positive regulator of sigma E activity
MGIKMIDYIIGASAVIFVINIVARGIIRLKKGKTNSCSGSCGSCAGCGEIKK